MSSHGPSAPRLAVLSLHTSPLAPLGGRETGGMNVYVREVSRLLAERGYAVDVFTRRTSPREPDVADLGGGARLVHVDAGPAERVEKEELHRYVDAFVDGVETFRAAEASRYDVVHSHYWLSAAAGALLADAWNAPHVAMFHTLADIKLWAGASSEEPAERLSGEGWLVHAVDRVVAATEQERSLLEDLYGVPPRDVSVIPPGVDTDHFRPGDRAAARRRLGLDVDERIVLAVGRLEALKGFDVLVGALAEMRVPARLLVIGGDDRAVAERERLLAQARALGIEDRVALLGAVPHELLPAYYHAADVVAAPSAYESFGLVAVEAMASGVPVVASRVGGLAATVRDGETGLLVPWRCPGGFAEALDRVLGDDAERARMARAASERAQAYAWPSITLRLDALYRSLAGGGAVPLRSLSAAAPA